jgi:large subunit ribosomal protein L13e
VVKGSAPKPLVKKPRLILERGIEVGLRAGKGFSLRELAEAGITYLEAVKLGIPVDKRRRSVHDWNIKILKDFLARLEKG